MLLPDGFRHVGEGRLDVCEERLHKLKVQKDIAEIYDIEQTWFAKGKYGIVRRAVDKETGVNYAAKFLRRRRRGQCCIREINHEIAVLMMCADSNHIVRLHAVHETRSEIALILELATGGELQAIIDNKGSLTESQTRTCMREVLKALQHLHKQSIAHLDLKPQNILLLGNEVEDGLKLCDFGIARVVEDSGKIYEILGTPDYVAPEVLHYEPLSLQTDIWSIGVLSYVLLTGCSPFGGDNKQETFLNITKCLLTFPEELFDDVSEDAIDFIKCTLRIKPRERLTVTDCLNHKWLIDVHQIKTKTKILNGDSTTPLDNEEINQPSIDTDCLKSSTNKSLLDKQNGEDKENLVQAATTSTSVSLFPDAPTTPKVSRKSSSETNGTLPAVVKTFVQKFHQQNHHHHSHHLNLNNQHILDSNNLKDNVDSVVDTYCSAALCLNCLKCGGESVVVASANSNLNARKSIQCDKGIIC